MALSDHSGSVTLLFHRAILFGILKLDTAVEASTTCHVSYWNLGSSKGHLVLDASEYFSAEKFPFMRFRGIEIHTDEMEEPFVPPPPNSNIFTCRGDDRVEVYQGSFCGDDLRQGNVRAYEQLQLSFQEDEPANFYFNNFNYCMADHNRGGNPQSSVQEQLKQTLDEMASVGTLVACFLPLTFSPERWCKKEYSVTCSNKDFHFFEFQGAWWSEQIVIVYERVDNTLLTRASPRCKKREIIVIP